VGTWEGEGRGIGKINGWELSSTPIPKKDSVAGKVRKAFRKNDNERRSV